MVPAFGQLFAAFIAAITLGQHGPQVKIIRDVIRGILLKRSNVMADIARALPRVKFREQELLPAIRRLSERLIDKKNRFKDDALRHAFLALVSPFIMAMKRLPVLAVDTTDITKKWAEAMEYMARVRDGSEKRIFNPKTEKWEKPIGLGFELLTIECVGEKSMRVPMFAELFSRQHPDWKLARETGDETSGPRYRMLLSRAIRMVKSYVPRRCLWSFDSLHAGLDFYKLFEREAIFFVVRMKQIHGLTFWANGQRMTLQELLPQINYRTRFKVERYKNGKPGIWDIKAGWVEDIRVPAMKKKANLPRQKAALQLSMVKMSNNIGVRPIILVTNVPVRSARDAQKVANAYHSRWGVEESYKTIKSLGLEKVRALKWPCIQRLTFLTVMAYGYLSYLILKDRESARETAAAFPAVDPLPEKNLFARMTSGVVEVLADELYAPYYAALYALPET